MPFASSYSQQTSEPQNLGTVNPDNTRSKSEKYSPWLFNT